MRSLPAIRESERGTSQITATLILIAIVVLLALLLLLMLKIPLFGWNPPPDPPVVFEIISVSHSDRPPGQPPNFDSRITLRHIGDITFENDDLEAKIYRNGQQLNCRIVTMNGHNFISTSHIGVQTMSGSGCQGAWWNPGEKIALDLTDGTIHPEDYVRIDILSKEEHSIISRDTATA